MTDYYVDGAVGNDANLGTSEGAGNAWATIQHAENTVSNGDTVWIKNSVTYSESITLATNGGILSVAWIGYGTTPGDDGVAVIDGTGNNNCITDGGLARDYRIFYNLRFTGATLDGCQMDASDYAFCFNCEFDNNGSDGWTNYYGADFIHCSFHDNGADGCFVHRLGKFSHCCFYNNGQHGFYGGDTCLYRNIFYENGSTYPEVLQDLLSPDTGVQYYHNVFYKSTQLANLVEWIELTAVALVNNIFVGGLIAFEDIASPTYGLGALYAANNCFYNQATQPLNERFTDHAVVVGSVEADPEFTDPATGDFTLQSTSPCIGAGQDVPGYSNRDIGAWPASGAVDAGALQAVAADGSDYLRRRREYHVRRQAAKRIGARELWWGQRRTKRLY